METMEKIQLKSQQPAGLQGSRAKIYREQAQLVVGWWQMIKQGCGDVMADDA